MPLLRRNASASCWSSFTLMPRNRTGSSATSAETCWNSGVSTRQGAHQEPQKLSTATSPASSVEENAVPSSSVPENSGAVCRSSTGTTSPAAVPATKRNSPPLLTSTASPWPLLQPLSSSPAAARSTDADLRTGHRVRVGGPGRLGVLDPDQPVVLVDQRGDAGQGALPLAGVVQVAAPLQVQPHRPDRQLVADADGLVAAGGVPGAGHGADHPGGDLPVRLAPRRQPGVAQQPPAGRVLERPVAEPELLALEPVAGLDQ